MLPNRFKISKKSEERLRAQKGKTGIPPNLAARELFFFSIESGKVFRLDEKIELGSIDQEKAVWLGSTQTAVEVLLQNYYPGLQATVYAELWAMHVEHGLTLSGKT